MSEVHYGNLGKTDISQQWVCCEKIEDKVIEEMYVKGEKENPVRYVGKRNFQSNDRQLCNWIWEWRSHSIAHELLLKNFVSWDWSHYMVPYLTVCLKSCCATEVSWEHFLHSPMDHKSSFLWKPDLRKVFSYIWCEEISTSSPPFPLPPFHDHDFAVPGLISNMKEETCIVSSLYRGKKYKILDNISVFLAFFKTN